MSRAMIEANEVITLRADHTLRSLNTFNPVKTIDDICRVAVPDAAAVLDEHVPGWHQRINRPLVMSDVRRLRPRPGLRVTSPGRETFLRATAAEEARSRGRSTSIGLS